MFRDRDVEDRGTVRPDTRVALSYIYIVVQQNQVKIQYVLDLWLRNICDRSCEIKARGFQWLEVTLGR